jgi:hypothetical protein
MIERDHIVDGVGIEVLKIALNKPYAVCNFVWQGFAVTITSAVLVKSHSHSDGLSPHRTFLFCCP